MTTKFKFVTLLTDFGSNSYYVGVMKGVILSYNPDINIVDLSHDVPPQQIDIGAYILWASVPYFDSAIHLAVVDPGVGTDRAILMIDCGRSLLVGPDNGLLYAAAHLLGIRAVYKFTAYERLPFDKISATFHGRDIFAPLVGMLSQGESLQQLGEPYKGYKRLEIVHWHKPSRNTLKSKIVYIDKFGNLEVGIPAQVIETELKLKLGCKFKLNHKGMLYNLRFIETYGKGIDGELIGLISSSELFELAIVNGSAKARLNAQVGDEIEIYT